MNEMISISRSALEDFVDCPGCFWLRRVKKVKWLDMPGWPLNSATDELLKKDADQYRGKVPHPLMEKVGYSSLIPFQHQDLGKWRNSLSFAKRGHFNGFDSKSNIKLGGGVDDIFFNASTDKIHIVDYKSTSKKGEATLENSYNPQTYKRQLDIYVWIAGKMGLNVSRKTFLIYVNGLKDEPGMLDAKNPVYAWMKFNVTVSEYDASIDWIDLALWEVRQLFDQSKCPTHKVGCDKWRWFKEVEATL